MTDSREILDPNAAVTLACQGVDVWNAWAAEHEGWQVRFDKVELISSGNPISFLGFRFPGAAYFYDARFPNGTCFDDVLFCGQVDFRGAYFTGDVDFSKAEFLGFADFSHTTFSDTMSMYEVVFPSPVEFREAKFQGAAYFNYSTFKDGIAFAGTSFDGPASFEGTKFADADFRGVAFKSEFELENSRFDAVPDFRFSKFERHVSLGSIDVKYASEKKAFFLEAGLVRR